MNTIMITGRSRRLPNKSIFYDLIIWGSISGGLLEFIASKEITCRGYVDVWPIAKDIAAQYFNEPFMHDDAHTQYLDHITMPFIDR